MRNVISKAIFTVVPTEIVSSRASGLKVRNCIFGQIVKLI